MNRSLLALFTSVLAAGAFGIACGDNEPDDSTAAPPTGGSTASGGESATGGDAGDSGVTMCADTQTLCGDFCASTSSDPNNCGSCDNACGAGEGCLDGECAQFGCGTGQVKCDEQCVNLQTDRNHCGDCDAACAGGEACENGICVVSCRSNEIECNGECIDPMTNKDNCGATDCSGMGMGGANGGLGTACEGIQSCSAGECVDECPSGTIACDGGCIDPLGNPNFCGASGACDTAENRGNVCTINQTCDRGECREFKKEWSVGTGINSDGTPSGTAFADIGTSDLGDAIAIWRSFLTPEKDGEPYLFASHLNTADKTWGEQVRIDDGSLKVIAPVVAVAPSGEGLAVWVEEATPWRIMRSVYDPANKDDARKGWTTPSAFVVPAGLSPGEASAPQVAMDANGNAVVMWKQVVEDLDSDDNLATRLAFSEFNGTSFATPVVIDDAAQDDPDRNVVTFDLDMNAAGEASLTWMERDGANFGDVFVAMHDALDADKWVVGPRRNVIYKPQINVATAIDGSGNAMFSYELWFSIADDNKGIGLYVSTYLKSGGVWGPQVALEIPEMRILRARMESNPDGEVVITAFTSTRASGTNNPPYEVIALNTQMAGTPVLGSVEYLATGITPSSSLPPDPDCTIGEDGEAHVVWQDNENNDGMVATYDPISGSWLDPVKLNGEGVDASQDSFPVLAQSVNNHAFTGWYGSDFKFYVARYD